MGADIYEPSGTCFQANGKEMMLVLDDEPRKEMHGWILYRHPDGQWVPLRNATDGELVAICNAVSRAHHYEVLEQEPQP